MLQNCSTTNGAATIDDKNKPKKPLLRIYLLQFYQEKAANGGSVERVMEW
jgi:hypothetical protein